jgi:NAD(P)-dependent dehydrogenase (short-subunit alcohol dehydrogenase family)
MRMYANTLRVEMRPFGMRVVDIVTGGVKTEMWNKSKIEILKGV